MYTSKSAAWMIEILIHTATLQATTTGWRVATQRGQSTTMHLKYVLRQINPNRCNLHGGRSHSFKWLLSTATLAR
jgi:hypothetical protein